MIIVGQVVRAQRQGIHQGTMGGNLGSAEFPAKTLPGISSSSEVGAHPVAGVTQPSVCTGNNDP